MTTREQLKRAVGVDRSDAGRGVTADPAPSLPERLLRRPRAQGRRPVPRRARHEDPGPLPRRPRARRLQGAARARSTRKGFLRNYALYLGLDPDEVLAPVAARARRRKEHGRRPSSCREADRGAAPGPDLLAGHRRRGAADGRRPRVRRLPRRPGPALRQATDDRGHAARRPRSSTSTSRRPRTRLEGDHAAGRHGLDRDAGPRPVPGHRDRRTATWASDVDLRRGRNQFDVSALDPETGKHSEETIRAVHHRPVPRRSRRRR